MIQLKVGDKLFRLFEGPMARYVITRLTPASAWAMPTRKGAGKNEEERFALSADDNGYITPVPYDHGYSHVTWQLSSPDLEALFRRKLILSGLTHYEWASLPDSALGAVSSIIQAEKNKALGQRLPRPGDLVVNKGAAGTPCLWIWAESDEVAMEADLPTIVVVQTAAQLRAIAGKEVTI